MSVTATTSKNLRELKMRIERAGICMTQNELEALDALLSSDHAQPMGEFGRRARGRNWILVPKPESIERPEL